MRALVTGAAGFIGSSLCDRLLADGHEVVGYDRFVPYYPRPYKDANLESARDHERFTFVESDLVEALDGVAGARALAEIDVVFHQAAQAGVRASWGTDFRIYTHNNILGTQVLLEAAKAHAGRIRVVYASSSSVYGETAKFPSHEDDVPAPVSPYGVSKLAAEHLARLYTHNYGLDTASLRYFTVYGPRQRPDMAFHRVCAAALTGKPFTVFGDGEQSRDFTFIDDIVQANLDAAAHGAPGGVYNIGGGTRITMNQTFRLLEKVVGRSIDIRYVEKQLGDVSHTGADVTRAREAWGFTPKVSLEEGLRRECEHLDRVVLPLAAAVGAE